MWVSLSCIAVLFFSHNAVISKMLEKSYGSQNNFILDHNNPQVLIEFLHVIKY